MSIFDVDADKMVRKEIIKKLCEEYQIEGRAKLDFMCEDGVLTQYTHSAACTQLYPIRSLDPITEIWPSAHIIKTHGSIRFRGDTWVPDQPDLWPRVMPSQSLNSIRANYLYFIECPARDMNFHANCIEIHNSDLVDCHIKCHILRVARQFLEQNTLEGCEIECDVLVIATSQDGMGCPTHNPEELGDESNIRVKECIILDGGGPASSVYYRRGVDKYRTLRLYRQTTATQIPITPFHVEEDPESVVRQMRIVNNAWGEFHFNLVDKYKAAQRNNKLRGFVVEHFFGPEIWLDF